MVQNGNTLEGSPGQLQSPELPGSGSQADGPGSMKAETPRKCSLCGSPNHHGCGCEAKAKLEGTRANPKTVGMVESEAPAAGPAAKSEQPADKPPALHLGTDAHRDELIAKIFANFSDEEVKKIIQGEFDFARDIKTMADGFEGLCAVMYDMINYLKIIAGDLITIRKILSKENEKTEPENAS